MVKLNARRVADVVIIDVVGKIVLGSGADDSLEAMRKLAATGEKKVILNLADTSFVDAAGIGILVSGYTSIENINGQLKLLAPRQQLREKLHITKLDTLFKIYDDEATAVRSFQEGGE
jgi:anti-sigma B factor antagonist